MRPGERLLFTDPIIVAGALSNEEIAIRSSIGYFLFTPLGQDERLIQEAGLMLVHTLDMTENNAVVPRRWYEARARRRDELIKIEGEAKFEKTQRFLSVVQTLASERHLSRFAFVAHKEEHRSPASTARRDVDTSGVTHICGPQKSFQSICQRHCRDGYVMYQ